MMDCNDTKVFLKEWQRMCDSVGSCENCKLHEHNMPCVNSRGIFKNEPEKAIAIVQEWSDAHQPKTRLSEFLEKYPKTKLYGASELPRFCVADLYGTTWEEMGMVGVGCADCWNTPMEQGVQ